MRKAKEGDVIVKHYPNGVFGFVSYLKNGEWHNDKLSMKLTHEEIKTFILNTGAEFHHCGNVNEVSILAERLSRSYIDYYKKNNKPPKTMLNGGFSPPLVSECLGKLSASYFITDPELEAMWDEDTEPGIKEAKPEPELCRYASPVTIPNVDSVKSNLDLNKQLKQAQRVTREVPICSVSGQVVEISSEMHLNERGDTEYKAVWLCKSCGIPF